MSSVRRVVNRVGPTLLHAIALPVEDRNVADVVIAEAGPRCSACAGDLVLAVTTANADEAISLIRECAKRDAAAVLLKPPLVRRVTVRAAATEAGIALIEVHAKTSWAQLVWLLRTVLDAFADDADTSTDDGDTTDLFRLADAAAAVVDAPVTIEDTNSRVLAYSARQDLTDPARVSTIMGRRIPDDVFARFRSRGVFRELSKGKQAIYVPAQADGTLPRLIVPIRMGGELLGSMWAVVDGTVSAERAAAFADAAPVVAVHLLRRRAHSDAHRRAAADVFRGLLDGTVGVRRASAELGIGDALYRVVAIGAASTTELTQATPASSEGLRLALLERISKRVGRHVPGCVVGDVLYLLVADKDHAQESFTAILDKETTELRAAAGSAQTVTEICQSRTDADELLGLLRVGLLATAVATFDESWTALSLHRAAVALAGSGADRLGPLSTLHSHDAAKRTDYVDTLYAWLRHPQNPRAAARELRIHPNTLRYRIRKLLDISSIDLDDPDVRLALLTQLVAGRWS